MSENKKHVHAELMLQYAQDALRTDKPWELWEAYWPYSTGGKWIGFTNNPGWYENVKYRRKPEVITVGNVSFPKPVDYELDYGVGYFYPNLHSRGGDRHCEHFWSGNEIDCSLLKIGFIHLTKEAAQQHCDALIKISKGEF
ncbi:hypothetical protein [Photorhabdus laumondii]|uniref:Photorhabdus luminescens subsp. laumondii TTO1 complete genome segment 10/17 n=1 Tax=Photorhabdus laumondii subsp. laumondii (strain DSM 15139 / CIP 105565 / TT01) TaxID=243265 RepID=Q7N2Z1_PHOLL|nr:hypothetical protein [Photorhabdus laumondii]AWK42639.1 hypothetical protein A4R40_14630 [Photorhabdus laumondii subsp. laumondii]AXG47963.1 hypothetical protein PluTT01m_15050 [Photorhabdus laumondii subsp. laumondii]CAE15306.1 unnamed protein product [Photorhabdus laumondii subsp. laumondii TTO1]